MHLRQLIVLVTNNNWLMIGREIKRLRQETCNYSILQNAKNGDGNNWKSIVIKLLNKHCLLILNTLSPYINPDVFCVFNFDYLGIDSCNLFLTWKHVINSLIDWSITCLYMYRTCETYKAFKGL
jgi:hypothetical protein